MSKEPEYPYGHPFWLNKPGKNEVLEPFPLCMEDLFQSGHVFKNGIKGTPCHSDSYMTCVDFKNLDIAFDIIQKEYNLTKEEWMPFLTYEICNVNTQPPLFIVAMMICFKMGIDTAPLLTQRTINDKAAR